MSKSSVYPNITQQSQLCRFFSLWVVVYVLLYILTSQFIPSAAFIKEIVSGFAKKFLHLHEIKWQYTGSGDTTYDYVLTLVTLIFSYTIAAFLLIIDDKRKNYRQLYLFTIVFARYFVAFTMITYGLSKVFNGQFPAVSYQRLDTQVGDVTPMGLVWTLMGASRPYTFICGLLEVVGGVLLLFRRTKTFGALFSMTVMINVTLLNYLYDVPVKLFSTHIVLLCIFILTYDWKILFNFFILHKTEKLKFNKFRLKKKWMFYTLRIVKVAVIFFLFYRSISALMYTLKQDQVTMDGVYTALTFQLKNADSLTIKNYPDSLKWVKLYISAPGTAVVRLKNEEFLFLKTVVDEKNRNIQFKYDNNGYYGKLNYTLSKDTVLFSGNLANANVDIISTRKTKKDYRLINTEFKWINEYPNNGRKR